MRGTLHVLSLLFIVTPCMAAAPAGMFCEHWALYLPAPLGPYPTAIPIQMGAWEQKSPVMLERSHGRLACGEALKIGQAVHSIFLFLFSFIIWFRQALTPPAGYVK